MLTLALNAVALARQARFGSSRSGLWASAWQVAIWMGLAALAAVVALICKGPARQILLGACVLACWSYSVVLPFLVLSVVRPFWRHRLTVWLKLTPHIVPGP
jgi:hypothetical protein